MGGSSSTETNPVQPVMPSRRSGDGDRGQQGQRAAGAGVGAAVKKTAEVVGVAAGVVGVVGGVAGGAAAGAAAGTVGTWAVAGAATGVVVGAGAVGVVAVVAFPVVAMVAGVTVLVKKSIARKKDVQPVTRSSSFEWLPPSMSELRVVLLGNSWSERSSVGNFILRETKFSTEKEPDHCLRVRGQLKEKKIVLINTPDLLHPNISEDKQRQHVERCVSLCDPGPHVFLLVLQPEDFTEELKVKLCRVLKLFSDQSFDHSLILISTPREESSAFMDKDQPLKDLIRMCRYRSLNQKNLERPELFTRLGQVVKENNGEHVCS